jgi:hypothetical protein
MSSNITSTVLFGNDIIFCWKLVEGASLYRIMVQSPTSIILDQILRVENLKCSSGNYVEFLYPKNFPPISPLIPHVVIAETINEDGVFSARAEFTIVDNNLPGQFDELLRSLESFNSPELKLQLDALLNSALKSPRMIGLQESEDQTFSPGSLLLEFSLECCSDSQKFRSELNLNSVAPRVAQAFSGPGGTGNGGWGWPR